MKTYLTIITFIFSSLFISDKIGYSDFSIKSTKKPNIHTDNSNKIGSLNSNSIQNSTLLINSGGNSLTHNNNLFIEDKNYEGGRPYTNTDAIVPTIYQTERSGPNKFFTYNIPVDNGNYTVILHFVEIYWGATGGGSGGIGKRIFDVDLEGEKILDDFDIYKEVGAETLITKSFEVTITDGNINIDFSSLSSVGGIDQAKISAIEVYESNINQKPKAIIEATPISGTPPFEVNFIGSNSTDDNAVVSYLWNFGDNDTSIDANPSHTYSTEGFYNVSLTVEDEQGLSDTNTITIESGQSTPEVIIGELKKWHNISILFSGPQTSETAAVNPFLNYRLNVTFTSPTNKKYIIPGFYAADGNAAETSAEAGNKWMVRFSPNEIGDWNYSTSFRFGGDIAISLDENEGTPVYFDGTKGSFSVGSSDKTLPDNRAKGRLNYVGERYLQFEETNDYFLKAGTDSPENLLGYGDFDNTITSKDWEPHVQDWEQNDPVWKANKGKGIIGAVNYLSNQGMNAFSFLTMNVNGDGKDVWPWAATEHELVDDNTTIEQENRKRYDISKLEQWDKLFEHADKKGMFLHFKTQETENARLLDDGYLGISRKLYYRELVARFGHHLALNWNLGEEYDLFSKLPDAENLVLKETISYIDTIDAYKHPIVVHSYPSQKTALYGTLLGSDIALSGPSIQSQIDDIHEDVLTWINNSKNAGKQWVVNNDEQGNSSAGVTADADYNGDRGSKEDNQISVRNKVLWATLMAGGAGVEYYFGYETGETDLTAQDYRSRENKWKDAKIALDFFNNHIPFWKMESQDELLNNSEGYCLAEQNNTYLIYLPSFNSTTIDLTNATGSYSIEWFNPSTGSDLENGSILQVISGNNVTIGNPPENSESASDWAILLTKIPETNNTSIRINVGGGQVYHNENIFESDQYFSGGYSYTNSAAEVPELYTTERSSPQKQFNYNIPVSNGDYQITLHFAEIYWGANSGGPDGVGKRIFDTKIEGVIMLDDYDIIAEVGTETVVTKTFNITISDEELNLTLDALGTDGVDQPKLSAIEIVTNNNYPSITVSPISNQNNIEGYTIDSLTVSATGGNPDTNFTYTISGQPNGILIDPSSGLIYGTLSTDTSTGGSNSDSLYSVIVSVTKNGSEEVITNFDWIVQPALATWTNKNENQNYTARHESSFVQAGNNFYLMGGRENAKTIDIYDYSADTWRSLENSAPFEFNHFQAIEYQGYIWVIGAFKDNNYPNETPAEYIWTFDTANEEWIKGSKIPETRQRGAAGLALHQDKFYIIGGNTNGHDGGYVPYFDSYDPISGEWITLNDSPNSRDHFSAVVINNKLYLAGGRLTGGDEGVFGPTVAMVDVYNFDNSTWSTLPEQQNILTERASAAAVNFNNKLVLIGGETTISGPALSVTEQFDPLTTTWSQLDNLNNPRHGTQAIVSGNSIYITGGSPIQGGGNQKNMEVLGNDSPVGTPILASDLQVPDSIQIESGVDANITLVVTDGNTGIVITSFEIIGIHANSFEIISGELNNGLIKANETHNFSIAYTGTLDDETASLIVNYDANSQATITLEGINKTVNDTFLFAMVDSESNNELFDIANNDQIGEQSTKVNIIAKTNLSTVGSVSLSLTGSLSNYRIENVAPYALFGDVSGNYKGMKLPTGAYTITATAYSGRNKSGVVLGTKKIMFNIINSNKHSTIAEQSIQYKAIFEINSSTSDILTYPNPTSDSLKIRLSEPMLKVLKIHIFDLNGKLVRTFNPYNISHISDHFAIDVQNLEKGIYMIKILVNNVKEYNEKIVVVD